MVSRTQNERVQSYIRKGIEEGAAAWPGGEGKPVGFEAGHYVKPPIFVDVRNDMTIAWEEILGPVLCVIAYRDDDHAVDVANDTEYGPHTYVFGSNLKRARDVAGRIFAGRVMVNGMVNDPTVPFAASRCQVLVASSASLGCRPT